MRVIPAAFGLYLKPHYLAYSIHQALFGVVLGMSLLGATTVAHADTAPAAQGIKSYQVAQGSLSTVLAKFAQQAGVLLTYDANLLDSKSSAGLSGSYSVAQGFNKILAPHQLQAVKAANGGYSIVKLDDKKPAESKEEPGVKPGSINISRTGSLPPIVLQAQKRSSQNEQGLVAHYASSATKTDTPLIETPQSISVVTSAQIEQQGATSLQDSLAYSAGVVANAYGTDPRRDWGHARGVDFVQYLDGLQNVVAPIRRPRIEPYALDRIEMLRGPSSVLYGQGTVGGIANMVSKRPQTRAAGEVALQYGQYDRKQVALDVTGPIAQNPEWLYRVVALARDSETSVDYNDDNRILFAPSLTWKPGDNTELTLLANYQKDESAGSSVAFWPALGTASNNGNNGKIPANRFVGEPGNDYLKTENYSLGWSFKYQLNDMFSFRQNARYNKVDMAQLNYYAAFFSFADVFGYPGINDIRTPYLDADPTGQTLARVNYMEDSTQKTIAVDNQLQAKIDFDRVENTLLFGVDYLDTQASIKKAEGLSTPLNPYNPVYGNTGPALKLVAAPQTTDKQLGLYLQSQSKLFEHVIINMGVRHDRAEKQTQDAPDQTDNATTAKLGVVYLFDNGIAPYVSYNESFLPVQGAGYKPKRGKQYEAGIKYQPAEQKVSLIASAYKINESNQLVPNPASVANSIQAGEADIKGFELEAKATVADVLDLIASYAYTDAKVESYAGDRVPGIARDTAAVWADYDLSFTGVPGLSIASGLRFIGKTSNENETLTLPHTLLWDAALAYKHGPWSFNLNALNLTNKDYITSCLARGECYYGPKSNVILTAKYKW